MSNAWREHLERRLTYAPQWLADGVPSRLVNREVRKLKRQLWWSKHHTWMSAAIGFTIGLGITVLILTSI